MKHKYRFGIYFYLSIIVISFYLNSKYDICHTFGKVSISPKQFFFFNFNKSYVRPYHSIFIGPFEITNVLMYLSVMNL